ncbi:glutamine amidotransferase [Neorhizobium sp. NPDC001467]|uniref:glutamine amidotransferase n=1 Tax=Neorhizobium sp. NPDC001467 TaxID=3390595 RepID=UPI003D049BAD
MLKTAVAIRHVYFENLGAFEAVLPPAGYKLHYHDVGVDDLAALDPVGPDLLFILGGPVGVYEAALYPFISEEQALISARLRASRPTVGICLGAQQIAAALGAKVAPTGLKEIGFAPLNLTQEGAESPLRHLAGTPVLHWHGDAFDIPPGGTNLATTSRCSNQAFTIGSSVLGVQFHPEIDACGGMEEWLVGHAFELAAAGVDPRTIRADAKRYGPVLRDAGRRMLSEWLTQLG